MFQDVNAITFTEFIEWSQYVEGRYELVAGHIVPHPDYLPTPRGFAAPDNEHNAIVANLCSLLKAQLIPPCHAYADAAIEVDDVAGCISDVAVSCRDGLAGRNLRFPELVFEVSSPSTYQNDTGRKINAYESICGLLAYIFIDRKLHAITVHRPGDPVQTHHSGDIILTQTVTLPFNEIFA